MKGIFRNFWNYTEQSYYGIMEIPQWQFNLIKLIKLIKQQNLLVIKFQIYERKSHLKEIPSKDNISSIMAYWLQSRLINYTKAEGVNSQQILHHSQVFPDL